jgi:serine phosphatase RsbU (regulator of sigma subunit)
MTGLVLLTVIGISIQFRKHFLESQTKQVQDSVQNQAERTASQIESILDSWRSQLAVALPTMRDEGSNRPMEVLQRFVNASPDFLSLQLLSAPSKNSTDFVVFAQAFTNRVTDPRFEEYTSEKVKQKIIPKAISWLQKQVPNAKKSNFILENASVASGLPLAWIAIRFDVTGDKTVVWAILTVWQTQILKSLANSQFIHTSVIDRDGKVFSSPTSDELLSRSDIGKQSLSVQALRSISPSGFVEEFKDSNGKRKVGAYSRLPKYGLNVLVEQDVEFAYQALERNLHSTILWAALFILIAIMCSYIGATGITKGLRLVTDATIRISAGNFKTRIQLKTKDEVGLLGEAVNNMSNQIVDLLDSQVRKAQFEKELETAKVVQSTFFPKTDPSNKDLTISSFYTPASECGGDLWGHFTISEDLEFVFVADAMGHGAPAALVTAMAYSATMTIGEYLREDPSVAQSPSKLLSRINNIIWEAVRGSISITFFASIIDLKRGILTYANAGHNFPILLPQDPTDARLKNTKKSAKQSQFVPISLKMMGTPLGIESKPTFKDESIELRSGDKLFYFTDGLIECESVEGEALGRKWLLQNICDLGNSDAHQLKQGILDRAFKFFGSQPIKDDITIVAIEISKDWLPIIPSLENQSPHFIPAPPTAPHVSNDIALNDSFSPIDIEPKADQLPPDSPSAEIPPFTMQHPLGEVRFSQNCSEDPGVVDQTSTPFASQLKADINPEQTSIFHKTPPQAVENIRKRSVEESTESISYRVEKSGARLRLKSRTSA